MLTDPPPRTAKGRADYRRSDALMPIPLPGAEALQECARGIAQGLEREDRPGLEETCARFLSEASRFYGVPAPTNRVLGVRPHRKAAGRCVYEKFGDYSPDLQEIRLWMRTAVRHRITAFGVFFSTLCHELCHHLDVRKFGIGTSPHTRGFYARAGLLYHLGTGTPPKRLWWIPVRGGRWRIDWQKLRAAP